MLPISTKLVPKKGRAKELKKFKPINLVRRLSKIVAKAIANKLNKTVGKVTFFSIKMCLLKVDKF